MHLCNPRSRISTYASHKVCTTSAAVHLCSPSSCCRPPASAPAQPTEPVHHHPGSIVAGNRSAHLDALKVFLTAAVIVHHGVGAFAGNGLGLSVGIYRSSFQAFAIPFLSLQQAYFMSLFFFVSALFAPVSLGRKGTRAFLADKAKRLVLPLLAMFWVLYPTLLMFAGGVIEHDDEVRSGLPCGVPLPRLHRTSPAWLQRAGYSPTPGPAWFLFWLTVFHACFALAARDPEVGAVAPAAPPALLPSGVHPAKLVPGVTYALPPGVQLSAPSLQTHQHVAAVPFSGHRTTEEEHSTLLRASAEDAAGQGIARDDVSLALSSPRPALWKLCVIGLGLGLLQVWQPLLE